VAYERDGREELMQAVACVVGEVSVLDRNDVDTDQIIPKQFLKHIERNGSGRYLFYDWAKESDWWLPRNPILVSGRNFGCGSSREHAVWELYDFGFRAVIAPSFSDIFYANATKNGLLPVVLSEPMTHVLAAVGRCEIDLEAQTVSFGEHVVIFDIDAEIKRRLLGGIDDIDETTREDAAIAAYERERARRAVTTAL
jgi:3-isopropylmalate/(R)-2-methylmalate dehydratase small subunit